MKPSWLIESDILDKTSMRLVEEIKLQGMDVKVASTEETYHGLFDSKSCVIFWGTLGLADQIRDDGFYTPGIYYNKKAFDCTSYYPVLGDYLLAEEYIMLPYGDLTRKKDYLYGLWGIDGLFFIRPNSGGKVFTGQLMDSKHYDQDIKNIGFYDVPLDELCVVSPPRNIVTEWRFVVVDQKVITGSQYVHNDKIDIRRGYDKESFELAEKIAKLYNPDRAWCVDICKTVHNNYYLLEIGCFSCAGLYLCQVEPIVREVSRVALEDWSAVYGDKDVE